MGPTPSPARGASSSAFGVPDDGLCHITTTAARGFQYLVRSPSPDSSRSPLPNGHMPRRLHPSLLTRDVVLALHLALAVAAPADRLVVPFAEFSDEDLLHIDLHDGSIDDWEDIVGEPVLTGRDAYTGQGFSWWPHYEPADFDPLCQC